ncbi:phosphatidylglycerophosphatase A [bacterium]|nr:phosphatidylglycerophosphatase A [bacterium]
MKCYEPRTRKERDRGWLFFLLLLATRRVRGCSPSPPATVSSFLVVVILWFWGPTSWALWMAFLVSLLVSVPLSYFMESLHGKDPSACTVDEVVGILLPLAALGEPLNVPGAWKILLAAFFLFRFFDIAKIWPASRFESLPGGWGIVLDDLMAGIYTLISLKLLTFWFL